MQQKSQSEKTLKRMQRAPIRCSKELVATSAKTLKRNELCVGMQQGGVLRCNEQVCVPTRYSRDIKIPSRNNIEEKIDDVLENLAKLCKKFDSFNEGAKSEITDADSLKKYVDAHLKDVKEMIAPALPIPQEVEVTKKLMGAQKKVGLFGDFERTKNDLSPAIVVFLLIHLWLGFHG